jgi:WD40 repeat protein
MHHAASLKTAVMVTVLFALTGAAPPPAYAVTVADVGGPYTVAEGDSLILDGSGSYDLEGDPITYQWNINNQDTWNDVTGVSPVLTWAQLQSYGVDDDGAFPVTLRATADEGPVEDPGTFAVTNAPPTLTVTGAGTVAEGATYALNISATDPGNDAITTWTVNWGDGTIETVVGNPPQVTHDYVRAGFTYDIVVAATDEDGTWHGSDLLVGSEYQDRVFRFAATTGAYLQDFGAGMSLDYTRGLDIGPDGLLYVCGHHTNNVVRFQSDTGAFVDEFVAAGAGGLNAPVGLTFGPDGHLYVADHVSDRIVRYDGSTGAYIDEFVSSGRGGLNDPAGIVFGPDGHLYVASEGNDRVVRFDGITGDYIDTFVSGGSRLDHPYDLTFGPDGHLYVASHGNDDIIRYDGSTGAFIDVFAGESGMGAGAGLAFGPDGHLYVSVFQDNNVVRFDGTTGAQIDDYVAAGAGGLDSPVFLTFVPSQFVTVTRGSAPVLIVAIPDTAVAEDAGVIDNYRNLETVFSDAEDGAALEYTIVSNSNPTLLATSIDGTNGLDLAVTPDSSGSATIVVRAADTSAQYVLDSFVVDVTPVADVPVALDDPGDYGTVVLSMNPIGYWRLGESAGPNAADLGSVANDGTYNVVAFGETGAITGDSDTAVRFDGSNSYVEIPHDDAYLLDDGSLQLWFNFAANPSLRQGIWSKDANGYVTGGHLSVFLQTDGSLRVRLQGQSSDDNVNSSALTPGQWHHVIVTFGSRGMELYVDGTLADTDPYTGGLGTTSGGPGNYEPAAVGANTWGSNTGSIFPLGEYYAGTVDEVAIYGKQLTLSEVRALHRAGLDWYQTDEETPLNVTAVDGVLVNDYDADGDPLTALHTGGPGNAQAFTLNPDGSFAYTPAPDYFGVDTFTYVADDGGLVSDTATVTIVVSNVNDTPVVVAALPDTTVYQDAPPIDNVRDLNDVFGDEEDGTALTFTIADNDNPALVTATIDPDSALDVSVAPGQSGYARLVVRATDSGALFVQDTMSVYVSPGVDVRAQAVGSATVYPGDSPRPMFAFDIANTSAMAETLTTVGFTNTTAGPGAPADLDAEFAHMTLTAQGDATLLPGGSPGPVSGAFAAGTLAFSGLWAPIAPGDTLRLIVEGAASTAARDGDVLDFELTATNALGFTRAIPVNGSFPIASDEGFAVDGMTAAQLPLYPVTTGSFSSGSADNLALDVTLPANGYQEDLLLRLDVVNEGTAVDTVDVVAVRAWVDDGDGTFDRVLDPPLGTFSWTGARWELTGLTHPVPAGGVRVFVSVDIADNARVGRTVRLVLPTLPDVAIGMDSANDGPIDAAVENPAVHTITTVDRVVFSAPPITGGVVRPGARDAALLHLTVTNNYSTSKQMTRLTVTNATVPQGAAAQDDVDGEFDNLVLREDANDNGVLDDAATDPVVGTAVFTGGVAAFTGLVWDLPPSSTRHLFVTADVSLSTARDGDILDARVTGAFDAGFADATTVLADWPVDSDGQRVVDGMVAAQVSLQSIAAVTLAPGDGPALALDATLPGNGYADDVLNSLTLVNVGTALGVDIADVRAWRDGGDGAFDAGAGDDVEMGPLFWTGVNWASTAWNEPLPATGARVFVGVTVAAVPTDSATVKLAIPMGGIAVASDNDGPIDVPVECAQTLLLSTAPLLAALDVQPSASTVGQDVTLRMDVQNVGGEQINTITPSAPAASGSAGFVVQSGPLPAALDLAPGETAAFTWVFTSTSAGDATWRATAQGTGSPSGLVRSSLEAASGLHRVFDEAIGVDLFPIESMPFLISRGQTDVVPLSLTFSAPGGATVSQTRVLSLRIKLEDGQGGDIAPASLLSRVVVSEGATVYCDKTTLETTGATVDLTLAAPAVIPAQEPVTLSIRLDILPTTTVTEFRVVIPNRNWFDADDAISGAPVAVNLTQGSWPVSSGIGRVTESPTELDVDVVSIPDGNAGWGQSDVELITLRLTNPGVAGLTGDVAAAAVRVGLVDGAGAPVATPSLVFERLRVRGPLGTFYAEFFPGAQDSAAFDLSLSPLLEVDATTPADVTVLADVTDGAPAGAYRLQVIDPSAFEARDANTGVPLPVVFASDPLPGRLLTIEAPADSLLASGTAAFPATVMVGDADVRAMTLRLAHPSAPGTGGIRIDAITLRCQNEVRNPLVPATFLSRVAIMRNASIVGTPASIPTTGDRVVVPLTGVTLLAGDVFDLDVVVDIATGAPVSFFEMTVDASGGIDAVDANLGSAVAVSGTLPATSGLTQLMTPPTELVVDLDSDLPAAIAPGAQGTGAATVTLTNTATSGSGPITLEHLFVIASDGGGRSVAAGEAAAVIEVWAGGGLAGRSDTLGIDSTSAFIPLSPPIVIQPQETRSLDLRVDFDRDPRVPSVRFGIDAPGFGIRQPQSALLQIEVEASGGQSFPLWTEAGSFNQLSLAGSFSNYPNPFAAGRESTRFVYYLPEDATVNLVIWSVRGERVTTIRDNESRPAGLYQDDVWDGHNGRGSVVLNGIYIAELEVSFGNGGGEKLLRKVAVVR